MNPQKILKIDRWLGRPACWLLTAVRRVARLFGRGDRDPGPPNKILFIKMIEQGATVLAYRAIARAVEMVGRENVYFWVFEENRPILDLLDVIPPQNVLSIRGKKPVSLAIDMLKTLWRIRGLGIDATVDMEFFARAPAILAFLSGARRRVGLHRFTSEGPYRGDLMTHRVQYNPYLHTAVMYYILVEALLVSPADAADPRQQPLMKISAPTFDAAPPMFRPAEAELLKMRELIRTELGSEPPARIVLLNPNASDLLPLRKWPTERFVELARRILADGDDTTIILTGGPSERAAAQRVLQEISSPRAISLAGRTTLRELLVLFTVADVLVTNDSGPGHFSSMTPIDTIVMFGPETPALFGPVGPRTHILYAGLACSPCVNAFNHRFSPCTNNVCMQVITIEQVHAAVKQALASRKGLVGAL
ncbi:MAG TPA: glycosyltransferase family 9 protein [Tepidisphaeraceae bacterium]